MEWNGRASHAALRSCTAGYVASGRHEPATPMPRMRLLYMLAALLVGPSAAIDNGIGYTPPMVSLHRRPFRPPSPHSPLLLDRPGLAALEGVRGAHQPGHHGDHDGRDGQEVPRRRRADQPSGIGLPLRREPTPFSSAGGARGGRRGAGGQGLGLACANNNRRARRGWTTTGRTARRSARTARSSPPTPPGSTATASTTTTSSASTRAAPTSRARARSRGTPTGRTRRWDRTARRRWIGCAFRT